MIHRTSRSTRRRYLVLLAGGVLAVVMLACRDLLTGPRSPSTVSPPVTRPLTPSGPRALRPGEAHPLSFTVTANDTSGGGTYFVPDSQQYKYVSWVTVTVSGFVTKTPTYDWTDTVMTWGPSGFSSIELGGVVWNIAREGFATESETDTVFMGAGPHWVGIKFLGPRSITLDQFQWPPRGKIECGPLSNHPEILCDHFTGGRTFTITPLSADLTVTPESTMVAPGSTPYVDYRAAPLNILPNQGTPFIVDSTQWIPDPESAGGEATEAPVHAAGRGACQSQYNPACRRQIIGSGTFILSAFVNGVWHQKSAHISASYLKLAANPVAVHPGDSVTFTPTWSEGTSVTAASITGWQWTPDVLPGHASPCAVVYPCRAKIQESGTMKVTVSRNGVTRTARTHVVVYSIFTLNADKTSAHPGDTVTFTPLYDGAAGPAARWRWVPDDAAGDQIACSAGTATCAKVIHGAGTMWAYSATGGDSASKHITALPRRLLQLIPSDTVFTTSDSTVTFTATGGGATVINPVWSFSDGSGSPDRSPTSGARLGNLRPRAPLFTAFSSSTCVDGVITCTDHVAGMYTRIVTATVDDSIQSASVVIAGGTFVNITNDSTCFDLGGSCWDNPDPDAPAGPQYVAPQNFTRSNFKLDFTDQNGDLHIFTLDATFRLQRIVKTTANYVDAIYAVDATSITRQSSSTGDETLIYANVIPIRSTLVETLPGAGSYRGGFVQNGRAGGTFWRPLR